MCHDLFHRPGQRFDCEVAIASEDFAFDVFKIRKLFLMSHFAGGSHCILEDLKEYMVKMRRNVGNGNISTGDDVKVRVLNVLPITHESCIFKRIPSRLNNIAVRVYSSY